jgi:hypothetical protein
VSRKRTRRKVEEERRRVTKIEELKRGKQERRGERKKARKKQA